MTTASSSEPTAIEHDTAAGAPAPSPEAGLWRRGGAFAGARRYPPSPLVAARCDASWAREARSAPTWLMPS